MKKFIRNIFKFIIPAFVYCLIASIVMPKLLSIQNGPSTEEQIKISLENAIKKDYKIIILGNSKAYRGLAPDMFSLSTYNFSHDNDSYNQIFYKLVLLLSNKKEFDYLILGVDYFQFSFKSDTRNYVYADILNKNYLNDFDNNDIWKLKFDYYLSNLDPKKLLSLRSKNNMPFLKDNGQYIKPGLAFETDTIQRDIKRLNFQVNYFNKILDLCKIKKIKVFIVMLPTRLNELKSYTKEETEEFDNFIENFANQKTIFYLNYSKNSDFKTIDYTDITHLNEVAANRFSKILNNDIIKLIEKEKESTWR
jgi:RNase H-fold protein (predicted Holliday junction resolvase)